MKVALKQKFISYYLTLNVVNVSLKISPRLIFEVKIIAD